MLYNLMLFFHILGTVGMFIAIGITLMAMISMLHANSTHLLQSWSFVAVKMDGLLPLSVLFVLVPGLYLVVSAWGWETAWINISLALLLVMTFAGPIINLRRLKAILTAANEETKEVPSYELAKKVRDRVLWNSVVTMAMLVLAILFLMTMKLETASSFIVLGTAIASGLITANILLSKAPSNADNKTACQSGQ